MSCVHSILPSVARNSAGVALVYEYTYVLEFVTTTGTINRLSQSNNTRLQKWFCNSLHPTEYVVWARGTSIFMTVDSGIQKHAW